MNLLFLNQAKVALKINTHFHSHFRALNLFLTTTLVFLINLNRSIFDFG